MLDERILYLKEKYGHGNVSQMITFGRLQGRSALKEVLRVTNACSFSEMNEMTKSIPNEAYISDQIEERDAEDRSIIRWSLINNPEELRDVCYINDSSYLGDNFAAQFDKAIRLAGTSRRQRRHAAEVNIYAKYIRDVYAMGT